MPSPGCSYPSCQTKLAITNSSTHSCKLVCFYSNKIAIDCLLTVPADQFLAAEEDVGEEGGGANPNPDYDYSQLAAVLQHNESALLRSDNDDDDSGRVDDAFASGSGNDESVFEEGGESDLEQLLMQGGESSDDGGKLDEDEDNGSAGDDDDAGSSDAGIATPYMLTMCIDGFCKVHSIRLAFACNIAAMYLSVTLPAGAGSYVMLASKQCDKPIISYPSYTCRWCMRLCASQQHVPCGLLSLAAISFCSIGCQAFCALKRTSAKAQYNWIMIMDRSPSLSLSLSYHVARCR